MFKKLMICGAAIAFAASLTACNTVQGAGKDIERGGEKVQDASKDVQKKM
jgi:entericidin B